MRKSLLLFTSLSLLLTACDSINDQDTTPDEVFEMMEGPDVQGINNTIIRLAENAEKQGNYAQAAQNYQQLVDNDNTNTSYAIRYGENLRKSGQPEKALIVFESLLRQSPNNVDALEGKGLALLSMGETDKAGVTLNQVMQLAPNRWRTLNAIGVLFTSKAMYPEAQQYFDTALQNQMNHPAILNNKGLTLAIEGQYVQALETLFAARSFARLPIQQTQADLNAALVYAIAGDTEQAGKMAAQHLQGAALQNNLGLYALLAEDKKLAKTHLHMALSDSKTFYEKAWNNLELIDSNSGARPLSGKRVVIGDETPFGAPSSSHLPTPSQ